MTETPYRWVPPGLNDEEVENFLSINRGIPKAAYDSLANWLTNNAWDHSDVSMSIMIDFQTASGVDLRLSDHQEMSALEARQFYRQLNEKTLTSITDYVISRQPVPLPGLAEPSKVEALRDLLHNAGSSWDVGKRQGRYGLVERVPAGVAHTVDSVLSTQDKASNMLRSAWDKAYGVSPSPSDAYHDAVKAVEIVGAPLVSPASSRTTLGTIFRDLEAQEKNGIWEFVMAGSKDTTAVQHLISTMKLLWHSQSDRHGSEDYKDVTVEEAKAAVLLASTLVGWLSQGALRKKTP